MRTRRLPRLMLASLTVAAAATATQARVAEAAPLAWPLQRLEIGLMDAPGGAASVARRGSLALRYQYLAGGVNMEQPWTDWGGTDGAFATRYVEESRKARLVPVFTFYEMRQSLPGASDGDEPRAVRSNLRNRATMRAYFDSLKVLFARLGEASGPTVVQVEPDLWGYVQQQGDDASRTEAAVASSGLPELADLPDTVSGFAQAIVRLRDRAAPRTVLGYHVSIWGTGKDITISNERGAAVDALAARAVDFYRSLGAEFDVVFGEFADRTAGYARNVSGAGKEAWWTTADFTRHARFMRGMHAGTGLPLVLWQIPLGNTVKRSMNDTQGHYQDNRVERLLSSAGRWRMLRSYRDAGVVALLFGTGQGGDTAAVDAMEDGTTNPAPINGNRRRATVSDDDGGLFRERVRAYGRSGKLALGG